MRRQRGQALIVMMVIIIMGALWWLASALGTPVNRTALHRAHNAKVLQQAKQALLAYAAAEAAEATAKYPGRLPCAEGTEYIGTAAQGIAAPGIQSGINAPSCPAIGRLPWRTLGLDQLRDADGEPLWYAVANGDWALSTTATVLSINSNKADGPLSVDGSAVVAAIVAPGRPIAFAPNAAQLAAGCVARTQVRTPAAPNPLDYVECRSGTSLRASVVDNATNPVHNDQLVVVTAAEVLAAIEPSVALRIQKQVVPQLQAMYSSATWGGSAATPIYPYAASFGDPAASDFKGTVGTLQGLLPLTASTCNALTAGRCDPNFVVWNTGSISATQTGGTATSFSADCSASTASQIECTITYSRLLCVLFCGISADVQLRADANNVGRTMKTLNAAGTTCVATAPATCDASTMTAPLQTGATAAAQGNYSVTLQGGNAGICGSLLGVLCTGTATITIPIAVFQDHALVSPAATDDWYWFIWNRWHDVTYYAVTPSHAPSGSPHDCRPNCISVTVAGGTPSNDVQATLVLAGRSLASPVVLSNRPLTDFLDTAQNRDLDVTFEQNKVNKSFNDRFVTIGAY